MMISEQPSVTASTSEAVHFFLDCFLRRDARSRNDGSMVVYADLP